jgi:outer membrane protein insertion porin family
MKRLLDIRPLINIAKNASVFIAALLFLSGCSARKFLKANETFYAGAKIKFDTQGRRIGRQRVLENEMEDYITPKPSAKIFGMRPGVWFFYAGGDGKKGVKKLMKTKLGKPPVLLKDATPDHTAKLLEGYLYNEGYFKSKVAHSVETKRKESTVVYTIRLERPFVLRDITFDSIRLPLSKLVWERSLLKPEQRYQLGRLEAEQKRIEKEMKDIGYYHFDHRYLLFDADSTVGNRSVDLDLKVESDMPQRATRVYRINQVTIFPEYTLSSDSSATRGDTLDIEGDRYVEKSHFFRPEIITRAINIRKGDLYQRETQDLTLTHLMGLGAFKFVNIKYKSAYRDSGLLNAEIYLTPFKKKSIRAEFQGVSKSNNFVGPGISVTFSNRNFLRGSELFQIKVTGAYEVQVTRQNQSPLNATEFGIESSLMVPRFLTPIHHDFSASRYLPKTQFRIGYNLQNRIGYFRLNSFNAGYGYNWRETAAKTHELFPVEITYVKTDKTSVTFEELLVKNPVLAQSFQNQFIIGTRYSYTINTQLREGQVDRYRKQTVQEHSFYFNGMVNVAGNLIRAMQLQFAKNHEGAFEIAGSPYSQFIKGEIDFRHYWQLTKTTKLVSRIDIGAGYAYGNSAELPYIKQFASGGSNSLRAFPARSVGPGSYYIRADPAYANAQVLFIDQRGDSKLEGNVEYRFDIYKSFKGAFFVDAGNIWLWHDDPARPGGKFDGDLFLGQLAVGTGFGLRYDFSFFVLRLDTAFPIRKPWLDPADRWVIKDIDFSSADWRASNLIFNIAIGYPF